MVQVERLKLLRIRLWGCIIGLLVPPRNDWYDWLVNHVPKTIKDGSSRAFKTFKDKIMGLYNRVTGSTAPGAGNQIKREELNEPGQSRATAERGAEPEWNFKEREQASMGLTEAIGWKGHPRWM